MTVAMFMLSRLEVGTSLWVAAFDSFVLGLGLGMVMQVLVLAVQNAVPHEVHGRGDERLDAVPPGRRVDRRRAVRDDLREPVARGAGRAPPGGAHIPRVASPAVIRRLPAAGAAGVRRGGLDGAAPGVPGRHGRLRARLRADLAPCATCRSAQARARPTRRMAPGDERAVDGLPSAPLGGFALGPRCYCRFEWPSRSSSSNRS